MILNSQPLTETQFGWPLYTASGFRGSQAIIGFIIVDCVPVFLTDDWQWLSETAIHTNIGRRNVILTLLMRTPLTWTPLQ